MAPKGGKKGGKKKGGKKKDKKEDEDEKPKEEISELDKHYYLNQISVSYCSALPSSRVLCNARNWRNWKTNTQQSAIIITIIMSCFHYHPLLISSLLFLWLVLPSHVSSLFSKCRFSSWFHRDFSPSLPQALEVKLKRSTTRCEQLDDAEKHARTQYDKLQQDKTDIIKFLKDRCDKGLRWFPRTLQMSGRGEGVVSTFKWNMSGWLVYVLNNQSACLLRT